MTRMRLILHKGRSTRNVRLLVFKCIIIAFRDFSINSLYRRQTKPKATVSHLSKATEARYRGRTEPSIFARHTPRLVGTAFQSAQSLCLL